MTELSFLIKLFLIPDIPIQVRDLLVDRINEVEQRISAGLATQPTIRDYHTVQQPSHLPKQAPSTLALMMKHGEIPPNQIGSVKEYLGTPPAAPMPVEQIAQTPATAAALQARQESINASISGRVDKTTGRPRKW